jgi:hypothetical protein
MTTPDIIMTDDEMQCMPWTRHLKKADELQRWVASRKEAGRVINIETCELGRWYAYDCDVYGVRDLPLEMQQIAPTLTIAVRRLSSLVQSISRRRLHKHQRTAGPTKHPLEYNNNERTT